MTTESYKGCWALITGTSSDIGREFCIQLAKAGVNLVLVARDETLLNNLVKQLGKQHQIQILALSIDLGRVESATEIRARVLAEGVRIRLLINNGAFGHWGRFELTPAEVYQEMIQFNTATLVSLCHQFLPDLTSFAASTIINITSPAAFQPVPYMAVYAATRAFVYSFSQALYGEWRERGVLVQTLIPGPTSDEFDAIAGTIYHSASVNQDSPELLVNTSLAHLEDDTPVVITAKGIYKQRLFAGIFPHKSVIREIERRFRP